MVPPPQVPDSPLGVETTRPEGKPSVKLIPVRVVAVFGFVMVKLSEVVALSATVDAPKDLLIEGGDVTCGKAISVTKALVHAPAQLDWKGC